MHRLFISTDLDRTLIPNGQSPESNRAREIFRRFVAHPEVSLAYVSGRHLGLVDHAIQEYGLPVPDWIVGDVGSTIYEHTGQEWALLPAWSRHLAVEWRGLSAADLAPWFAGLPGLTLQPEDRQNTHKLSFFLPLEADLPSLTRAMQAVLDQQRIAASLIYSVDEQAAVGLMDVLPQRATKLDAVEFLMREQGFDSDETVFAGDSGNDLAVLASSVPAVLVANARADVADRAMAEAQRRGTVDRLYLAKGGFMEMNGNYSAGILEGIAHFHAETVREMV
jgi:HAD superfamily hydrolase (TIGR01484 family)